MIGPLVLSRRSGPFRPIRHGKSRHGGGACRRQTPDGRSGAQPPNSGTLDGGDNKSRGELNAASDETPQSLRTNAGGRASHCQGSRWQAHLEVDCEFQSQGRLAMLRRASLEGAAIEGEARNVVCGLCGPSATHYSKHAGHRQGTRGAVSLSGVPQQSNAPTLALRRRPRVASNAARHSTELVSGLRGHQEARIDPPAPDSPEARRSAAVHALSQ
jgi:hypothetical protein